MLNRIIASLCFATVLVPPTRTCAQAPQRSGEANLQSRTIQIVAQHDLVPLIEKLNALYVKSHPGIGLAVRGGDNYSAMAALTFNVSAFAPMTSEFTRIGLGDNLKIAPEPIPFRVAHGSLKKGTLLSPLAVIVNNSNPLKQLTMDQVARAFVVGAPGGDMTRWSQLGVHGPLAERDIVTYGPPSGDYFAFDDPQVGEYLGLHTFNGLNFNHTYTPLPHYKDIVARVESDPDAVGITTLNTVTPAVKVVGLVTARNGAASTGSTEDIVAGHYALDRYVYIYLRVNPGTGLDPFASDYLHMVLSPEGQHIIATEDDGYIPLSPREAEDEIAKLQR